MTVCLLVQGRYGALFNWKSDLHKQKNVSKLKHNNGQIILRITIPLIGICLQERPCPQQTNSCRHRRLQRSNLQHSLHRHEDYPGNERGTLLGSWNWARKGLKWDLNSPLKWTAYLKTQNIMIAHSSTNHY